jgi:hypothetical protein
MLPTKFRFIWQAVTEDMIFINNMAANGDSYFWMAEL